MVNGTQFWSKFLRYYAERSNRGEVRSLDGVEASWMNSALSINNGTYLTARVSSDGDLRARLAAARDDAAERGLPWALFLYSGFAGRCDDVAREYGIEYVFDVQEMTGDTSRLQTCTRPEPAIEFRRVDNREEAKLALDINMRAYGMPESITDSVMQTGAYFSDPGVEFGFVAYAAGVPVSTATVIELGGWLYVALVATEPEHRQMGYAEAVMRHALSIASAERGITRTALDASAMGAPIYERMGYQFSGERWSMYAPTH